MLHVYTLSYQEQHLQECLIKLEGCGEALEGGRSAVQQQVWVRPEQGVHLTLSQAQRFLQEAEVALQVPHLWDTNPPALSQERSYGRPCIDKPEP